MKKNKMKLYFLWLAGIIVLFFLLQLIIPSFTDTLILNEKALINFEYWRFLSSIFLHGSVTHLFFNLFALLFFGILLEKKVGSNKFLIIFLASGIIANIISVNFYTSSLGASGAIYGIMGALTIMAPFIMVWAFGLMMPMFIASIIWVIADVLRTLGALGDTNIGSIAHLSGIAIGIIAGIYLRYKFPKTKSNKKQIKFNENQIRIWEDNYMK
ncbi:MAG: rhomboid family intramembrane serine protease [archaeon]